MSTLTADGLAGFLKTLRGKRLALVYSSRFEGSPSETWYHRWRSDIIGLYSIAAEMLGMEQMFLNIDQFLEISTKPPTQRPEFVVNLNAGNRFLGNLSLVPSVCRWLEIPVAFCDARTAIVSEDKRLSKMLAKDVGFRIPHHPSPGKKGQKYIAKPIGLGSSVGVQLIDDPSYVPEGYICEEFIQGYDATIVLIKKEEHQRISPLGAKLMVPKIENASSWIYSEAAKEEAEGSPELECSFVELDGCMIKLSEELAQSCGSNSVARIDIRYTGPTDSERIILTSDNTVFIEYNAMPTMGRKNSVNEMTEKFIHDKSNSSDAIEFILKLSNDTGVCSAIYLMSTSLFEGQLQMK